MKKKRYRFRFRLFIYSLILIGMVGGLGYTCFSTWQQINEKNKLKQDLENKYQTVVETGENLEGKIVRLQDPEYSAKYAREKYLYSKPGELIIDFSKNKEDE